MYLGTWRYAIFRAGVDDCIFTQVVNGAFNGFSATLEGSVNHLLVHFSPILLVAMPFVRTFDGARGLIVLQCALAAGTIVPVWGIAAARLPKWLAFAATLVAATYPPLSAEAVGDFHELAFAPPLTAALVWAIDRRWWRSAMAISCVALVKEDQFVALTFIGIVVAAMSKRSCDPARADCGSRPRAFSRPDSTSESCARPSIRTFPIFRCITINGGDIRRRRPDSRGHSRHCGSNT